MILSDDELTDSSTNLTKKSSTSSIIASLKGLKHTSSVSSLTNNKRRVDLQKSWFFRSTNNLLDYINQVLNDTYMQRNSKRVAIILLSNLHLINPKQAKLYSKKKNTFCLLY